jgi:hypothetical protein
MVSRAFCEVKVFTSSFTDGCLSHKTAVALGALSQYLYFALDPGDLRYQQQVQLHGVNYLMKADVPITNTEAFISRRKSVDATSKPRENDYDMGEIDLNQKNYGVQRQEEEQYSYYGNEEKMEKSNEAANNLPPAKAVVPSDDTDLPGTTMIMLTFSAVMLILMFRCIRQRRILIRYRHR